MTAIKIKGYNVFRTASDSWCIMRPGSSTGFVGYVSDLSMVEKAIDAHREAVRARVIEAEWKRLGN
jgi:hypothetical protein